jgi:hypothetical protein
MQLVTFALPEGELGKPDGQATHVELAEAPIEVEYVPAPQSVQAAVPVDSLYFPATHAVHVPPSGPVSHSVVPVSLFLKLDVQVAAYAV